MARLSINDLNNLSGLDEEGLNKLYKCFRKAHTKLLNDIIRWCNKYNQVYSVMKDKHFTDYDYNYKRARAMYYYGTQILDNVDIFSDYVKDYVSLLTKLRLYKVVSNIMMLDSVLNQKKKDIINLLPECYEMWEQAFKELYKEEI